MSELKPCPFCGSENIRIQPEGDYWEAYCIDCDVARQGSNYERMTDAWNERVNSNWIDVSDRLPEIQFSGESKTVLVTLENNGLLLTSTACLTDDGWREDVEGLYILAWQPIPEPYQRQEEEI